MSPVGTATEAAYWMLIEDPSPWGEQAVEDADWYSDVQPTIARWQEAMPALRVQLIRRDVGRREHPGQIRCVAVRAGPQAVVRAWTLDTYRELAGIDVPAALDAGPATADSSLLLLTCVNGQRDACCAKWGRPVAEAAAEARSEAAWRTSHLGGHRFAPTVIVLPHGTHYGWLRPDDMPDLMAAHREGRLFDLDRIRGHVHQRRPVQAACLTLRRQLPRHGLDDVWGTVVETAGEEQWVVRVQTQDETYTAHVQQVQRDAAFPHSCGSDSPKSDVAWRVTWGEDVRD